VLAGCLESYQPPAISDDINILVVDGFINATEGSAQVRISRATALSSDEPSPVEPGALVEIEDTSGSTFALNDLGDGNYSQTAISILPDNKYRLIIRTNGGNEYSSDFITITKSPPIDSITSKRDDDMLIISVNTHDPESATKYYQWSFKETWEYNSTHYSSFKMLDGQPVVREDNINLCWGSSESTQILIASTDRLSQDLIFDFPIASVPKGTGKLSRRYSILVEQRALTKEGYDFWLQLKKTTESLGGLFDPLPSQVLGNIRSIGGSEPVLGYFSGGYTSQKRYFIRSDQLPNGLFFTPNNAERCVLDSIPTEQLQARGPWLLLVGAYPPTPFPPRGYTTASPDCIDCRLVGGTTARPDFW
jgi:hypothetical protein